MEFDEEQDKGYKIKVNAPASKNKSNYNSNKHEDDFIEEEIEEIES